MKNWIEKRMTGEKEGWEIEGCEDWEIQMQFSPLRQSLFNWYEFKQDAKLLELQAGYGALTGLFCERCKEVTAVVKNQEEASVLKKRYAEHENLRIQSDIPEESLYDYVVVLGVLEVSEDPAKEIQSWMKLLKEDGILLLAVENRYGLKYFCGARDPYTRTSFEGVNGYLNGAEPGRCFSRKELLECIEKAGAVKKRFYYPVPDSRMPQMIFTDEYQKGLNTAERLIDYDYEDSSVLGIEHRMFCEMIDDGALKFMANSFLVEITKKGKLSDICYAVTTTDRGPLQGMATTIRREGTVIKRPLWRAGEENLRKLHSYTEKLSERGVPVVKTTLEEDAAGLFMSMPYINAEGLSTVMKRNAEENREEFLRIFDEIYCYIQKASEQAEETAEGPVLKEAYLDLAPCNCFYEKETGTLLFYDQEFVQENCPARYAMFRTLKYCYASARSMEKSIPLSEMYARYGIDEKQLQEFEEREKEFIASLRSTDQFHRMYQWGTPDYQKIQEKMKKVTEVLAGDSKKPYRVGYVPGVFDLFHTGHLILLERCKERCDYLIVGVLTDELVEYYKGHRTVISYEDRARVIEALKVVDEVIPVDFSNTDKLDAWEQLHYDCHFSGDDHRNHWNPIWEELKRRGSNMEFFPYTQGISSTQIREKMK